MEPRACAFCGQQKDNLLQLYFGGNVADKRSFCDLCITTNACMIPFQQGAELDNRVALQLIFRLADLLLEELRQLRRDQASLRREEPSA